MESLLKLGIDWRSILLYAVNMGIIFFIIARYLVPTILKFLDERREQIASNLEEANKIKDAFKKRLDEMQAEKEHLHKTLKDEIESLRNMVEQKRETMLKEIEQQRFQMLEEMQHFSEKRKKELVAEVQQDLSRIMKQIVVSVIEQQASEEVIQKSINTSWKKYLK